MSVSAPAARCLTGGPHDNGRSVTLKHDALTLIAEGTERAGSVSTSRRKQTSLARVEPRHTPVPAA